MYKNIRQKEFLLLIFNPERIKVHRLILVLTILKDFSSLSEVNDFTRIIYLSILNLTEGLRDGLKVGIMYNIFLNNYG